MQYDHIKTEKPNDKSLLTVLQGLDDKCSECMKGDSMLCPGSRQYFDEDAYKSYGIVRSNLGVCSKLRKIMAKNDSEKRVQDSWIPSWESFVAKGNFDVNGLHDTNASPGVSVIDIVDGPADLKRVIHIVGSLAYRGACTRFLYAPAFYSVWKRWSEGELTSAIMEPELLVVAGLEVPNLADWKMTPLASALMYRAMDSDKVTWWVRNSKASVPPVMEGVFNIMEGGRKFIW